MTTETTVRNFLRLPAESLPAAQIVGGGLPGLGSAWDHLRDGELARAAREINGRPTKIRLHADRPEWAGGVAVEV